MLTEKRANASSADAPFLKALAGGFVHLRVTAEEGSAELKLEQLLLKLSICRQLVGLVDMCYFPVDQP